MIINEKLDPKSIFLLGKSIGTAFATYVASKIKNIGGLIMISPFLSIKKAVSDLIGNWGSFLFRDMLNTETLMKEVEAPVLLIHGKQDKLFPYQHSEKLVKLVKNPIKKCIVHEEMNHTRML